MDLDIAAKLRAPFPPEKIGKLPRVTCGKCRDSRERVCDLHSKSKCGDCGSWVTSAHIHLDFVGHADATDRFLEVDPEWTWEPLVFDEQGLPKFDEFGGLWIRLTIAGVTRLGYGDADGKRGGNAIKESIGDALRNASMRFGVALDLWRKDAPVEESAGRRRRQEPEAPAVAVPTTEQRSRFDELAKQLAAASSTDALRIGWDMVVDAYKSEEITTVQANELRDEIARLRAELVEPEPSL